MNMVFALCCSLKGYFDKIPHIKYMIWSATLISISLLELVLSECKVNDVLLFSN